MKTMLMLVISCLILPAFAQTTADSFIQIEWVNKLKGNYSFTKNWNYNEMRMISDDCTDSTRYYHTISCDAHCYEWAGTDFINAYQFDNDTVKCYTECNAGTHSSLAIILVKDQCIPHIVLNSIVFRPSQTGDYPGLDYFRHEKGTIRIDQTLWKKGILKAEFDFTFIDPDNHIVPMWWKGKIRTTIQPKPRNLNSSIWWMGKVYN